MLKVAFIVPPQVELLDLAGPAQVFTEARFNGYELAIEFYSYQDSVISTSGIGFGKVANFREANLQPGDKEANGDTGHTFTVHATRSRN